MFDPGPCVYMEKVAVGPEGSGVVDIEAVATENLKALARPRATVSDLTAVVLDRPRHDVSLRRCRTGARSG